MYPIGPAVRRGWAACLPFGPCEGHLGPGEALAILAAGTAAGAVNAVVGSGSLITFPALLAFGFSPVVANVSNSVGLVPGNLSSGFGYRRELAGQRGRLVRLGVAAGAGAPGGANALLSLPARALRLLRPVLIPIARVLGGGQPWPSPWVNPRPGGEPGRARPG